MELKTKIHAEDGKQEITITREFDLPLALLFKAYEEPELVEQWMGNKVIKLENKAHGSYQFEKRDPQGNLLFSANGVVHEFSPNQQIIRTFEMEKTPISSTVEFLTFEALNENTSKLTMHVIYKSVNHRNQMLQLPFAQGINMAHNLLQKVLNQFK